MAISRGNLKIIGHRGWPARYPDNVLAGIAAATEVCDMVEVDVRRCSDGALVLAHDPHLSGKEVASSEWGELRTLDLGGGHPPASLDQLLASFPEFPFNLEVKNSPGEPGFDESHLVALETAARARPGDLVSCFFWPSLDAIRRHRQEVATGLLVDVGWSLEDAVDHAGTHGHVGVIPHWSLARDNPATVAAAAESGLQVVVWTLNDPEVAVELAAMGVSAIITDDPGLMAGSLGEHR
jgi:glycerophosphoryl diester phosphodiesterase